MSIENTPIRFTSLNLGSFLGNEINNTDANKLNTIFQECNIANEKGEKDDVLTGKERINFLKKVKENLSHLYQKVVDFHTTVEVSEELEQMQNTK